MEPILNEAQISLPKIYDTIQLSSPTWILKQPDVNLVLYKLTKKNTHPISCQEKLYSIQEKYHNCSQIYTDNS